MNEGMISGIVVRVEDKSSGFPAAIVTLAGETDRNGKPLVFFEHVRLTGQIAQQALGLQPGEAVLFDRAAVEQMIWNDQGTNEPRSQIAIRGRSFVRLQGVHTRRMGEHLILEGAMNIFSLRGRLAKNAETRRTGPFGEVTEVIVTVNLPVRPTATETRPHYLKVEAWRQSNLKGTGKGTLVITQVLVKTDMKVIEGKKRYFTVLEERSSNVAA
ncbi:hypothetical protein [Deinococcus aluminii]|uniref:Single-stranded DNA-binding protein n=1 Tax=Deinococcus aluminii TaxID=1656885 RepID=A0ABP9XGX4_9DEIO